MVRKWKAALTIDERQKIFQALCGEMSYNEMAAYVGRPRTTVMRESKRLGAIEDYDPHLAQEDFEYKQTLIGKKKKINEFILFKP